MTMRSMAMAVLTAGVIAFSGGAFAQVPELTVTYDARNHSHEDRLMRRLGDGEYARIRIVFLEDRRPAEIPEDVLHYLESVQKRGGQVRLLNNANNFDFDLIELVRALLPQDVDDAIRRGTRVVQDRQFGDYHAVIHVTYDATLTEIVAVHFVRKDQPELWANESEGSVLMETLQTRLPAPAQAEPSAPSTPPAVQTPPAGAGSPPGAEQTPGAVAGPTSEAQPAGAAAPASSSPSENPSPPPTN